MSVQGAIFAVFVLIVWLLALLFRSPRRRQILLLTASYCFYGSWGVDFAGVLLFSSVVNYGFLGWIRQRPSNLRLWTGLGFNLTLLALYKYLPGLAAGSQRFSVLQHIIMPIGISFWTFQALSASIDTYQGDGLQPSLLEFCLYMAFWPTVLCGPICRLSQLMPQFRRRFQPSWEDVAEGVRRIVLGLFFKVALAYLLAFGINPGEGVNNGFDQLAQGWGGIDVWMLAIGFGFQLFFDFAGYSHIVIGTARLFGIRLPENFNLPFLATTPPEFWSRWHISLSSWIRDYIFLPLAMVKPGVWWRQLVLVFAMALFGLWHGATLPFLCWGLYQGFLLAMHRQLQQWRGVRTQLWLNTSISWAVSFATISLGWVFFRVRDIDQAIIMLKAVFSPAGYFHFALRPNFYVLTSFIIAFYFLTLYLDICFERYSRVRPALRRTFWILSPAVYAAAILLVVVTSKQESAFVYLRF